MSHHYSDYEAFKAASPENRRLLRQEELILDVTEALAEAMQREGVKEGELSYQLGKPHNFVSQVLSGERQLTLRIVADIAGALGYRIAVTCEKEVE